MSIVYFVIFPILASFLTPFSKKYLKYLSFGINFSLLIYALTFIPLKSPIVESISVNLPISISFILDSASLFFIILFTLIMTIFSLYNIKESMRREIFILTNIFLASVSGLVLSGDIFNIYIFFEMASITAYIFTSLKRDKKAYSGAIRYMIVGSIASIFLLIGIMSIYLNIGSLNLVIIGKKFLLLDTPIQSLILISLFIGFGIKAEIFPLNFWVVDIYQATDNKINLLFSSILSKAYIFVFFHLAYILHVDSKILLFLATIGVISFGVAELSALNSRDIKRIFAYSTLGQIGVIFIGLSTIDNITLLTGAIFLIAVHSITKVMLFLSLDILEERFNSTNIDIFSRFSSIFLFTIFIIGLLSLLGLPPFAGFIAKLTILNGLVLDKDYIFVVAILIISLIEATYIFRLLGLNRDREKKEKLEIDLNKKILLSLLAIIIIYLGVSPQPFISICRDVALTFIGGVHV